MEFPYEEDVTCTVCLQLYDNPLLLQCEHSYCAPCVDKLYSLTTQLNPHCAKTHSSTFDSSTLSHEKDTTAKHTSKQQVLPLTTPSPGIRCPDCGFFSSLPDKGDLQRLRRNEPLSQRVASFRQQQTSKLSPTCGICERQPASLECQECQFEMCQECREKDHSRGRYKEHKVVPLGELARTRPRKCAFHEGYLTDLLCLDCGVVVCLLCNYMGAHKGHRVEPTAPAEEDIRGALKRALEHANARQESIHASIEGLDAASATSVEKQCDLASDAIRKHFNELHERLTARQENLLQQVRGIKETRLKEIHSFRDALVLLKQTITGTCEGLQKFSTKAHFSTLLARQRSIRHYLQSLCKIRWTEQDRTKFNLNVNFDATEHSVRQLLSDMGKVTTNFGSPSPEKATLNDVSSPHLSSANEDSFSRTVPQEQLLTSVHTDISSSKTPNFRSKNSRNTGRSPTFGLLPLGISLKKSMSPSSRTCTRESQSKSAPEHSKNRLSVFQSSESISTSLVDKGDKRNDRNIDQSITSSSKKRRSSHPNSSKWVLRI